MSFEFELPDFVWSGAFFALPLIAISLYLLRARSQDAQQQLVARWAARNLVELTPEIAAAYLRASFATSRLIGAIGLVMAVTLVASSVALPDGSAVDLIWVEAVVLGTIVTIVGTWRARRPWLDAGSRRIAHTRATRLADYVPPPLRVGAWFAGASCLTAAFLAFPHLDGVGRLNATAAVMVVVALGVAEWTGAVAATHAQPARDAVELYAVDAWRTGNARLGLQSIAMWGGVSTNVLAHYLQPHLLADVFRMVAIALMFWSGVGQAWPQPIAWTRRRLWPTLAPGERVSTQAVAA
ncbi:MAG: hypothetical protein LWW77_08890 [Propionibacteriales bacterium]|nr:hypothetical protein [Propionibacteriales bacterium]